MIISYACLSSVTTQKLDFLSFGCLSTGFSRLGHISKVSDSKLKIQPRGSSCVSKISIDIYITRRCFSHFVKNESLERCYFWNKVAIYFNYVLFNRIVLRSTLLRKIDCMIVTDTWLQYIYEWKGSKNDIIVILFI